jgi:(R,R)-butanediol dehydrogenase/meso-butanediol dehydrogenase/diacetyl reductase
VQGLAREAIRLSRRGGTTVLVGIHGRDEPFDLLEAVLHEKHIVGSAAHLWDEDVAVAVDLLARGHVDGRPLLTRRVQLEEIVEEGFKVLEDPGDVLKILITPRFEPTRRHQKS